MTLKIVILRSSVLSSDQVLSLSVTFKNNVYVSLMDIYFLNYIVIRGPTHKY